MKASVISVAICLCAASAAKAQPLSTVPSKADVLAAASLRHSAGQLVRASDKPVARAARLVGLARFADRLAPGDGRTNRILAFVYASQDKLELLTKAVGVCLAAQPGDHAMGLRWLSLELGVRQQAHKRIEFLSGVLADGNRPAPLRAAAAVQWADILSGQGQRDKARNAYAQALKLDPYLPAALRGYLASLDEPTPVDRVRASAGLLVANPRALSIAAELGEFLDALGLYKQAVRFYDYAWQVNRITGRQSNVSHDFIIQYCNAMLNAGQHARAINTFETLPRRFVDSLLLRSLLIEACRATGKDRQADRFAKEIQAIFTARTSGGELTTLAATELAWLQLVTGGDVKQALKHAGQAAATNPDDFNARRVLSAARLLAQSEDLVQQGEAGLVKLADKDIFATAFLAEHYFKTGKTDRGKKMVLVGLSLSRSGHSARRLLALAAKHKIVVPPAAFSIEVGAVVESIDPNVLEMGLAPEKFVTVTIRPLHDQVAVGEPLVVEVVMANIGKAPVPLGQGALVPMALNLSVSTQGPSPRQFADVQQVVWPAPRYLQVGQSTKATARIDVGALSDWLVTRPLTQCRLTVFGMLVDPARRGRILRDALPAVVVGPAVIARTDMLDQFDRSTEANWSKAYRNALGVVVGDMKNPDPAVRMRAVRRTTAMLALTDAAAVGDVRLHQPLIGKVARPVLVLMVSEALKDRSDLVRAEMLAALQQVKLDAPIIRQLTIVVRDGSALVQFRLVELLGASGLEGQEAILAHFAEARYDLIAELARAFVRLKPGQ